jgi:hypothetical protein
MKRRAFLAVGGQTATFALAARIGRSDWLHAPEEPQTSPAGPEQRVARVIQAYDAQGNHRTGTEVDRKSAEWLARELRRLGVEPSLEPFTLSRIDAQAGYLRVAERRIDGVPLFDAGFTAPDGVQGRLGPLGSDAEMGLAESEPATIRDAGRRQRNQVQEWRRSQHQAVVVATRGVRPGLFLLNASAFTKPSGPPILQISSAEIEWLRERAAARAEATLVAQVSRMAAQASNVTAKIAGSNPAAPPLVLMAPRSGWWTCASEQGSRLACWCAATT